MKLKRRLQAFLIALVMVFGTLAPGVTVHADPTAEGTVSFLSAPDKIGWADGVEAHILQFSAVEGATGYEIVLSVPSKNFWDACLYIPQSGSEKYEYDIKSQMEYEESMCNEDLSGELTISVYAFSGNWQAINISDFHNAAHKDIATSAFVSYVGNLPAMPTPQNVNLNLSEDNKLTVSFNKVQAADGTVPSEYNLLFLDGDKEVYQTRSYQSYQSGERSDQLIWTSSGDGSIEIAVPDDFRQINLSDISSLSVKVSAWSNARYTEGEDKDKLKYKVSEWSTAAAPITNKAATVVNTGSVTTDEFNENGTTKTISNADDVKALLPNAAVGTTIKVEVKTSNDSSAFTNGQSGETYNDLATFEVNLKSYAEDGDQEGTNVTNTNHPILITVPIPEAMQGKRVVILTNHNNEGVREVASTISNDGQFISFYADKFSPYAMAVEDSEPENIKITFKANGGSGDDVIQMVAESTPTALTSNAFTRSGYTFTGWNTTADGTGTSYADGEKIEAINDLTLYAQWKKADAAPSTSGGGPAAPAVDRTTATNTVSDAIASAKSTVSDAALSSAVKDLAASLIDQAKADADKNISAASSTTAANTAATNAEMAIKEITARVEKAKAITDITGSGDQKDAVQYGIVKGYIQGTSDTTFGPTGDVTRAQFVTFLYRLAGSHAVTVTAEFNDVKDNANLGGGDFAAAIQWASKVGIAKGFSDGSFKPGETVTREQAVAFLHRYFTNISGGVDNAFADVKDGAWYDQDISWGVGSGVVKGISATEFGVGNNTTRAQAAQFIYRAAVK